MERRLPPGPGPAGRGGRARSGRRRRPWWQRRGESRGAAAGEAQTPNSIGTREGCVPREGSGEGGALQEIFCDFRQVGPLDLPAKIALTADKSL